MTGFSDGASYALSLGIGNGDVFGHILAFSPGVMQPATAAGKPRIFISHGTADQTMPIDDTSRKFVPRLKALGYDVVYREFDGRHSQPADHSGATTKLEQAAPGTRPLARAPSRRVEARPTRGE